jgi:hypothetical protein
MRTAHLALFAAAALVATDSLADPPGRPVIPPRVERADLPSFDAEPFPEEKSKAPRPGEWKDAKEVRLGRVARRLSSCRAHRLREWMKIHCDRMTGGLRLVAGSSEGIELWVPEALKPNDGFSTVGRFFEIVFPVRRGDRRIFETFDFEFGEWEGFGTAPGVIVEEQWMEGAPKPQIALLKS